MPQGARKSSNLRLQMQEAGAGVHWGQVSAMKNRGKRRLWIAGARCKVRESADQVAKEEQCASRSRGNTLASVKGKLNTLSRMISSNLKHPLCMKSEYAIVKHLNTRPLVECIV